MGAKCWLVLHQSSLCERWKFLGSLLQALDSQLPTLYSYVFIFPAIWGTMIYNTANGRISTSHPPPKWLLPSTIVSANFRPLWSACKISTVSTRSLQCHNSFIASIGLSVQAEVPQCPKQQPWSSLASLSHLLFHKLIALLFFTGLWCLLIHIVCIASMVYSPSYLSYLPSAGLKFPICAICQSDLFCSALCLYIYFLSPWLFLLCNGL